MPEDPHGKLENDMLELSLDKKAPEIVRDQAILGLMDLSCPSLPVLEALDDIRVNEIDKPVGETATLTLGAMLRKRRVSAMSISHTN